MLDIIANGSGWNDTPNPLTMLVKKLQEKPLDPIYEAMGNFIVKITESESHSDFRYRGCTRFVGHFATIPYVFNIVTDEKVVIEQLAKAIRMNQQRLDYEALKNHTNF
ncbi:pyruvate/2-oxoglutarate dehydrogenase complex dehydrogenase (E1) component eukaryotic type beta subunit [Fictibacillus macauensis ZFHKF-1]|uniref:Pyruvate/2-oxoglutarate dehydrogenase complex dehydrogenase (E1) component eukaryotic type beta subunit n=1 Tax=Fictibacillus macauensis ZFHKF-1 TaxID=1196324 RepID=I8UA83_9BACL|nr:hypothetical protein [Fictibacillus macauensis]EIT83855.1 pyruvate/2-oxoglutarate dehydrogenase complex dehydrogenase (E1) component eukaryotic type beta subunit [Fictibacillus macauensis ZFHKF-1]